MDVGKVDEYPGDLASYEGGVLSGDPTATREVNKSPGVKNQVKEPSPSGKGRRQSSAEERAALRPLQKALQKTERELESLQSQLATLQAELALPELYDEGARDKLAELVKSEGALKVQIATVEETWMEQQEALESASPHSG